MSEGRKESVGSTVWAYLDLVKIFSLLTILKLHMQRHGHETSFSLPICTMYSYVLTSTCLHGESRCGKASPKQSLTLSASFINSVTSAKVSEAPIRLVTFGKIFYATTQPHHALAGGHALGVVELEAKAEQRG